MASGSNREPLLQNQQQDAPPAYTPADQAKQYPQTHYSGPAGSYQGGAPYMGPPGYQPVHDQQPSYMQGQPQTVYVQPQPVIAVVGGCPACRVGILEDDFTILGVCCAILFFPLGILCCLLMRQRRCANCGAVFG